MARSPSNLDVETSAEILDILGFTNDPIYRHGKDTTINELAQTLGNVKAREVWIEYHVDARKPKRGTVYQLVLERIRTVE